MAMRLFANGNNFFFKRGRLSMYLHVADLSSFDYSNTISVLKNKNWRSHHFIDFLVVEQRNKFNDL